MDHPPPDRHIRIEVTLVLPRRLVWLLAGMALGNLGLSDMLLDQAIRVLRALLPG